MTTSTAVDLREMRKTLRDVFGLEALRPGQREIIRSVAHGHDTLAIMPTGAGKSLCYQLPAMHLPGLTLVVSPLIALMKDQFDKLVTAGVFALQINSTLKAAEERETWDKLRTADRGIVFVTPEQLTNAALIEALGVAAPGASAPDATDASRGRRVSLVVIDEAHCVSQWGHDFRPAFLQIADAVHALGAPPMLALTATATPAVTEDIVRSLGMRDARIFRGGIYRENLRYRVMQVSVAGGKGRAVTRSAQAKLDAVRELLAACEGPGIIYTATVREADNLVAALRGAEVSAAVYHGRMSSGDRHDAQERFMNGDVRVMVATNAFGMGIDKSNVRFVVHYQMPGSIDSYYQETGRAGRDGEAADCVLLFDLNDRRVQQFLLLGRYPDSELVARVLRSLEPANGEPAHPLTANELADKLGDVARNKMLVALKILVDAREVSRDRERRYRLRPRKRSASDQVAQGLDSAARIEQLLDKYKARSERDRDALQQMIDYAQSGMCRWRRILAYFGDDTFERCGTCDNCIDPPYIEPVRESPTPQGRMAATARKTLEAQRGFARGEHVRVRKYGTGQVEFATAEQVAVLFPDGTTRTFLSRFVKHAPA